MYNTWISVELFQFWYWTWYQMFSFDLSEGLNETTQLCNNLLTNRLNNDYDGREQNINSYLRNMMRKLLNISIACVVPLLFYKTVLFPTSLAWLVSSLFYHATIKLYYLKMLSKESLLCIKVFPFKRSFKNKSNDIHSRLVIPLDIRMK